MSIFWISFIDYTRPAGREVIGVSIVEAATKEQAIDRAHELGCHQGGKIWTKIVESKDFPKRMRNRALTSRELGNRPFQASYVPQQHHDDSDYIKPVSK